LTLFDIWHSLMFWGSRDVIGHTTIWYPIGHFLLVALWNGVSKSSRFWLLTLTLFDIWHSLMFWGSRDVIGHTTIWYPIGHFLLVVLWNQASISNGFLDIQWRMQHNDWHDLNTTSKQRSRSFILVPIDFSYTTSNRLSIVTSALGHTI